MLQALSLTTCYERKASRTYDNKLLLRYHITLSHIVYSSHVIAATSAPCTTYENAGLLIPDGIRSDFLGKLVSVF